MQFKRILHGGDYNPEQWLDMPEKLDEDIRLMKEAHVNCVTLGVFSWVCLEPEEGKYDIDWLEKIIDNLAAEDIDVILATPTGAMPHWMTTKYEEVRQVFYDRNRNLPGKRHNFCYTSPVFREKAASVDRELAKRLGNKPNVILWHISNEFGGNWGDSRCYCPLCQEKFKKYIKDKYKTLDNLNKAYWTTFWSHRYTDWDQVHSPMQGGEDSVMALNLDWKRFTTKQLCECIENEKAAIREYSNLPVTTNYMEFFDGHDYQKMSDHLDVISWDCYPTWHAKKSDTDLAIRTSSLHSLYRSIQRKPFLLMESTPSLVNWQERNAVKRPGMHELSSLHAIAHGSDSVQYFQWRKSRGSAEQFHGAVLDHKNGSNTRVFKDVQRLGKRLEALTPVIDGTVNKPQIAIVFDWENKWLFENLQALRSDKSLVDEILNHYEVMWHKGVDVDFISMDQTMDEYKVVIAPFNYMYKPGYADRVRAFVENGGTYVTGCFSGIADDTDITFIDKHPLEDVFGIIQEEIDSPSDEWPNSVNYKGKEYEAGYYRELIHTYEDTQVLGTYTQDYVAGEAAITSHAYGSGRVIYLATNGGYDLLDAFYSDLLDENEITNPFEVLLPENVTVTTRVGENDKKIIFVLNFENSDNSFAINGEYENVETGEKIAGNIDLKPYEVKIVKGI